MVIKVLLIEDESKTAQYLKKGLEENGFEVDIALDGKTGRHLAFRNDYDIVITDLILPGIGGREITQALRQANMATPVLMLTALSETDDVVAGFESGADDYLAKPFEFRELLARVRALAKRKRLLHPPETVLEAGDLTMWVDKRQVMRGGKLIELTAKEFALLEYLLRNKGRVVSKPELARNVWNIDFDTGTNMVEVYVNYLRRKIDRQYPVKLIHTQFGMGYVLRAD
jgi:two-component system copper resistance phosphate regulon response regulator CusR